MTIPYELLLSAADVQENVQNLTQGMTVNQVITLGSLIIVALTGLLGLIHFMIRNQTQNDAKLVAQRMQVYEESVKELQKGIEKLTETVTKLSDRIVDSDALNNMIRVIVVEEVNKAMATYNAIHDGK